MPSSHSVFRRVPAALAALGVALASGVAVPSRAAESSPEDYWEPQRALIRHGQQAMMTCHGLFVSGRTLEQIFAQELAYLPDPEGSPLGGDYRIDRQRRTVEVGGSRGSPRVRAAWRPGLGCMTLGPEQDFSVLDSLPKLTMPPLPGDPATTAWPDGDRLPREPLPAGIDAAVLAAASDRAFDRPTPEQLTLSLLVVHRGRLVHERYAKGVDMHTRTRTWSVAKSINVTLIGMLVDQGKLSLDAPLGFDWLPAAPGEDPRATITLRHLLHMSSGLYPVDSQEREYATGSGLAYWAGASSVQGALDRGLVRQPGSSWDYENYDTLLAVLAMKRALGGGQAYLEFPRRALFDRIGMRGAVAGTDRFGDFILSSQVLTSARDLARFGLLYLNRGTWNGQRLLSESWIDFVRTPAPASSVNGHDYGAQWWLVPDARTDVPRDAYAAWGNRGQFVIVVPSRELVIVRRGLDWGAQGFDPWALLADVLKAFPG
jgi:CubicO group peptidase (beta-lactamase class C family)